MDVTSSADMAALHAESAQCPWLLVYYDSSCGHCRTMAPRLASSAGWRGRTGLGLRSVLIGAINCAVQEQECRLRNISDVPTIFFVAPGATVWQPLAGIEDTETAVTVVRRTASVTLRSMNNVRMESCVSLREFHVKTKQRAIADLHLLAANSTVGTHSVPFVEQRAFYQEDIAGAFYYTMQHGVPMVPLRHLRSLTAFLNLVAQILPGLRAEVLLGALKSQPAGATFVASEWKQVVSSANIPFTKGSEPHDEIEWRTCKGSGWQYRGFTCGLWLLYHALTVNAGPRSGQALLTIRQYVTHFFACENCRHHFSQFQFHGDADGVLQLWKAHNQVNARLQQTVDGMGPLVPKRQFPDTFLCSECILRQHQHGQGRRPRPQTFTMMKKGRAVPEAMVCMECVALHPTATTTINSTQDDDTGTMASTCSLKQQQPLPTQPPTPLRGRRNPSFVLRRDPIAVNVALTVIVVGLCVYAGRRFADRELSTFGSSRGRRRVQL